MWIESIRVIGQARAFAYRAKCDLPGNGNLLHDGAETRKRRAINVQLLVFDQAVFFQFIDYLQQLAAIRRLIQPIDSLLAIRLVPRRRARQGVGAHPQVIGDCLGTL